MIYVFDRVENIVRKGGRKCWLPAFSPFPTMLSKGLYVSQRDVLMNGLLQYNTTKYNTTKYNTIQFLASTTAAVALC